MPFASDWNPAMEMKPFVWQRNLLHSFSTRDVIILHGNIRDLYVFRTPRRSLEVTLDELIARLLSRPRVINRYDPYLKAARLEIDDSDVFRTQVLEEYGSTGFNVTIEPTLARIFVDLTSSDDGPVWMLKQMHNMAPYRSSYSPEDSLRLIALQNLIERIRPGRKIILCYLSESQVPEELAQQAHRTAFVKVPLPDYEERVAFWRSRVEGEDVADDLAKMTDGMALSSLKQLLVLASSDKDGGERDRPLSRKDWEKVVARYKFGEHTDHYQQISVQQLSDAMSKFTGEYGVQGQDQAIEKTVSMLWKARTNVPRLLRSGGGSPPRGCLFFCGPSGVGKTMVAKKIALFVFGSEDSFCRIDMSEYQQDFTVSKLIGAPPGYVGHEAGGILTNAVIDKPFSVLLFDEIEKADARIFDLFLQLLSDGRLTDSRGRTVFFSEAIIVFTSNIGTRAKEAQDLDQARQSGDPELVRSHFSRCVRNFFRHEIGRPELLNRIGPNIVPFNYLDEVNILAKTVSFYLRLLRTNFDQEYGARGWRMELDEDEVARAIVARERESLREFGGRGVLNTLDELLLPPLARRLLMLERSPPAGLVTVRVSVAESGSDRVVRVD